MLTLIAIDLLRETVRISRSRVIISGIVGAQHTISTRGAVSGEITLDQTSIQSDFQIIDREYAMAGDGYLGFDFLIKFKAIINFHSNTIKLTPASNDISDCSCSSTEQFNAHFSGNSNHIYEMEEIQSQIIDNAVSKLHFDNTGCLDCSQNGRGVLMMRCTSQDSECCDECSDRYNHFMINFGCEPFDLIKNARTFGSPNERGSDIHEFPNQIANTHTGQGSYFLAHTLTCSALGQNNSISTMDDTCNEIAYLAQTNNFLNREIQQFTVFSNKGMDDFESLEAGSKLILPI